MRVDKLLPRVWVEVWGTNRDIEIPAKRTNDEEDRRRRCFLFFFFSRTHVIHRTAFVNLGVGLHLFTRTSNRTGEEEVS